jgi:hypothetical protein
MTCAVRLPRARRARSARTGRSIARGMGRRDAETQRRDWRRFAPVGRTGRSIARGMNTKAQRHEAQRRREQDRTADRISLFSLSFLFSPDSDLCVFVSLCSFLGPASGPIQHATSELCVVGGGENEPTRSSGRARRVDRNSSLRLCDPFLRHTLRPCEPTGGSACANERRTSVRTNDSRRADNDTRHARANGRREAPEDRLLSSSATNSDTRHAVRTGDTRKAGATNDRRLLRAQRRARCV